MAYGKYSPYSPRRPADYVYKYNAKGQIPPDFVAGEEYDEEIHFGSYDEDGFDSYGYSAYDSDGTFVGTGNGVDPKGMTEHEHFALWNEEQRYCRED